MTDVWPSLIIIVSIIFRYSMLEVNHLGCFCLIDGKQNCKNSTLNICKSSCIEFSTSRFECFCCFDHHEESGMIVNFVVHTFHLIIDHFKQRLINRILHVVPFRDLLRWILKQPPLNPRDFSIHPFSPFYLPLITNRFPSFILQLQ